MNYSQFNPEGRNQWKEALKRLGLAYADSRLLRLCMLHFHPDDIVIGKRNKLTLRPGTLPKFKSRPTSSFDPR